MFSISVPPSPICFLASPIPKLVPRFGRSENEGQLRHKGDTDMNKVRLAFHLLLSREGSTVVGLSILVAMIVWQIIFFLVTKSVWLLLIPIVTIGCYVFQDDIKNAWYRGRQHVAGVKRI